METTRIITVAREYGSGGAEMARQVAEALGWEVVDAALVQRLAQLAHLSPAAVEKLDERPESWPQRLLRGFRFGAPESGCPWPMAGMVDGASIQAFTVQLIRAAAELGRCVLVGRGSQCVLRGRRDALHVFIYAPPDEKMRRLRSRHPEERDLAGLMETIDHERAAYIRDYFHSLWNNPHLYDLCLNSGLGLDVAAGLVEQAAARKTR